MKLSEPGWFEPAQIYNSDVLRYAPAEFYRKMPVSMRNNVLRKP